MNEINLIWQTEIGRQTNFKYEYITKVLFKNFKKNIFFDKSNLNLVINNSVIIYSCNSDKISKEFEDYLNKYVKNNFNFYLIHLSNDNLNHDYSYYSKASHVFREYYDNRINLDNVTFIPVGFKSGFYTENDDTHKKIYNFSFIGELNPERAQLTDYIKNLSSFIHESNPIDNSNFLNEEICKGVYSKTKFIPCPMGNTSKDSSKIMESLESVSIPIVMEYDNLEYFTKVWGNNPIPIIKNWENLEEFVNFSDEEYFNLLKNTKEWYFNFKQKLSDEVKQKILKIKNKKIEVVPENKFNSLIHFITPLHKKNNIRFLYQNIVNLTQDFNWYLIEGSETVGCETTDFLLDDNRVHFYKIQTQFIFGHEQRNYFIENIKCEDNDWCFFLDDDTFVTQDLIEIANLERTSDVDIILLSQKKGLTEIVRLRGIDGHMTLGNVDIGSFLIRYKILKNNKIPMENSRNSDGHYAESLNAIPNIKIKYFADRFTRYNCLSHEIT